MNANTKFQNKSLQQSQNALDKVSTRS